MVRDWIPRLEVVRRGMGDAHGNRFAGEESSSLVGCAGLQYDGLFLHPLLILLHSLWIQGAHQREEHEQAQAHEETPSHVLDLREKYVIDFSFPSGGPITSFRPLLSSVPRGTKLVRLLPINFCPSIADRN